MIRVLVRGEKGKPEAGQRGGGQVTMKTGAGECSREHGEPQELVEAGRTLISGRGNKPDMPDSFRRCQVYHNIYVTSGIPSRLKCMLLLLLFHDTLFLYPFDKFTTLYYNEFFQNLFLLQKLYVNFFDTLK